MSKVGEPALLSTIPGYAETYVSKLPDNVPSPLTSLFEESMLSATFLELLVRCEGVFSCISVSTVESASIEKATAKQAKLDIWFQCSAGRVTASNFKVAARSDPHHPPVSLVQGICYPEAYKFST